MTHKGLLCLNLFTYIENTVKEIIYFKIIHQKEEHREGRNMNIPILHREISETVEKLVGKKNLSKLGQDIWLFD